MIVVDTDTRYPADYAVLQQEGTGDFSEIAYISADNLEQAAEKAGSESTVILLVEEVKSAGEAGSSTDGYSSVNAGREEETQQPAAGNLQYELQVLLPEGSDLTKDDGKEFETFINDHFETILMQKSGLNEVQRSVMAQPVQTAVHTMQDAAAGGEKFSGIKSVLSFVLPYVVIMALYFMIILYGQNVANCVIQEKTSKLMDNLLLSVRPAALVMGKMLAVFLTGVMQTLLWAGCLASGFAIGSACVKAINPDTNMLLVQFFGALHAFSGIFSAGGIFFAVGIFLAGFLLYCAIAAMGGSLASKQEDLNTTNMLFTMILLVSFFATFFGGVLEGNVSTWMLYVPFTAVLVAPGEALLGNLSLLQGGLSLGILILSAVFVVWLAGKIYAMLVLYKGNPPSIKKMIQMMKK